MIYAILFWFGSLVTALAALSGLPWATLTGAIVVVASLVMFIRVSSKESVCQ